MKSNLHKIDSSRVDDYVFHKIVVRIGETNSESDRNKNIPLLHWCSNRTSVHNMASTRGLPPVNDTTAVRKNSAHYQV